MARQKIYAAISAHPKSHLLIRAAAKKAKEKNCLWGVIYVETPEHDIADQESRERVLHFLSVAEEMGATIERFENTDIEESIVSTIAAAQQQGERVHTLILGQRQQDGFWSRLRPSLAAKLARRLRNYQTEVQIIPLTGRQSRPHFLARFQLRALHLREVGYAFLATAGALLLAELSVRWIPAAEPETVMHIISPFFLIATALAGFRWGLIPGLITIVANLCVIDFFYLPPRFAMEIRYTEDSYGLMIFLLASIILAFISASSHANASTAIRKERRTQALHRLYRIASGAQSIDEAVQTMHRELSQLLEMEVAFFLPPQKHAGEVSASFPKEIDLSEKELESLEICWQEMRATGMGSSHLVQTSWRFEPMVTPNGEIGIMGVKVPMHIHLDASFGRLISALADQAANIIERIDLMILMGESRVREEREKLRAMLLSSVSHDLKTPLASIIGSMSVYKRMQKNGRLTEETAMELTDTALDEAQRLDSFISNILEMTRIESGDIKFNMEWIDAAAPLETVKKRLRQRLRQHELRIVRPDQPARLYADKTMCEQILQNVIDNAVKYSPVETTITVTIEPKAQGLVYRVRDQGSGIPEDKQELVFDKYERLKMSDSTVAGTGLGLAICRAVIERMNGSIFVHNPPEGGAEFVLAFSSPENQDEETARSQSEAA